MLVFHHSQLIPHKFFPKKDLMRLFLAGLCRKISQTFISLFSSVYIYQTSINAGNPVGVAIIYSLGFYLILLVVKSMALLAAEDYSRVHGFKASIISSVLPFLLSIVSFILVDRSMWFFVAAAVFWGIHAGFYWWGYHGYFVKAGSSKSYGKELGEVGLLETLAVVLTPIVGSVVIASYGFSAVYILSTIFVLVAAVLLLGAEDKKQKHDVKLKDVTDLFRKHRAISFAYTGSAIEAAVYTMVWPLFLFIFASSIVEMGLIISMAVLVSAVFGVIIGDFDDKYGEEKLVALGTPIIIFSWFIRVVTGSVVFFVTADAFWNFGQKLVSMPMNALTYRKAAEKYAARAILFRELAISMGAAIGVVFMIIIYMITNSLVAIFIFAMFVSTLPIAAVVKGDLKIKSAG